MTDYLNVYVLGVPMVSIPIKSEKQLEVFKSVSAGQHEGDTFISKTHEPVLLCESKAA